MRYKGIIEPLIRDSSFQEVTKCIRSDIYPVEIDDISDSARALVTRGIYESTEKSILVLCHNDIEARNMYEDLSILVPNTYFLPCNDIGFYNLDAISGDVRWERLKVLQKILEDNKKIVVTTMDAVTRRFIPINMFQDNVFKLSVGDVVETNALIKRLINIGYERVLTVEQKGQFSMRGGIIDIFSPVNSMPYRIELFDDEIDSIRMFNAETQRSTDKAFVVNIFPAKEVILYDENIERGINLIESELESISEVFKKENLREELQKIRTITNMNLEALREKSTFENIDSYLPYFYEETSSLLEYMGDVLVVVDEPKRSVGRLEAIYNQFNYDYNLYINRGDILTGQANLIIEKDKVIDSIEKMPLITFQGIVKPLNEFKAVKNISINAITLNGFNGQLDLLYDYIKEKKSLNYKTVIFSGSKSRGLRLIDTLRERNIEAVYREKAEELYQGEVIVTEGVQHKGYEFPELNLAVVSDRDFFGEVRKKSVKKKPKKGVGKIKSFTELKPGDYVVHESNGIGVYKGIKQIEIKGIKKDYLDIEYAGSDKLYVPVYQLDLVQKYIGSEGKTPKVNKLSSIEWTKAKKKAKKAIEEIAEELVKLYAERSLVKGYKYSGDNVWQKQFEEEFPYVETDDQISAIEDIKRDMESEKIMDRLLCGDVGYGKTEVALRAAFKAVMDGKQVAVLVPTTILAKQHYSNFLKRFSSFPVNVDMACRFRTPLEQKKTLKNLSDGSLDVIIGTHRILQKDVKFKDLGLLIVDEEQRFGVKHKEKIKELKKNVDVLTLSATPIPRTLHMSLTGVRDISVIETPPEERFPIQTYVVEFNDHMIRDAIIREISRGGQVFFVYNRVEHIHEMKSYLEELIPEARIGVGHGQMTERELENVMVDFMDNKYDILLCTTIIETGIDIQNCNTMIIYDADKMGLSQLYQLRGRVGRSNRIAYAYFTYKKDKVITEVAEKRLKAIKEFTELGSGFKIAMRDLEIRGAGNMMGSAQHGQMATIGYDLYCKMLEQAVAELKGEVDEEKMETSIEIKIDAYIPDTYVSSPLQKIDIYKKIAAIAETQDVEDIRDELIDRYSDIPTEVNNLIEISYMKSLANKLGVCDIKENDDKILFVFASRDKLSKNIINRIMNNYRNKLMIKMDEKPVVMYNINSVKREKMLTKLIEIFTDLQCHV
ncbi:transcription-repair coupling factor [Hathewaya proteolytica DSM 3090]|uniref:Transcription-repair-coupling factor n=1 Tax=Hathewaya proteolytica DSM 3090 TaxID=1121331 RepID=A0A1M6MA43_9CLOT|nr:transcription-repair coupling factor [Hathewaya proteolytica]SHJ80322.1 transcription-repair coupling factor [Hathewaya proteolytica DSM 3090]